MRLTRAWLFAACAGCSFAPGIAPGGMTGDGGLGGEGGPDARACFGSGLVRVCFTATPPAEYATSGSVNFNTDTDCTLTQVQSGGPDLCIKAAQMIRIGHEFDVRGVRPLVLVATNTLIITSSGELDVSSNYTTDFLGNINGQHVGAGEASADICGAGTQGGNDAQANTTTGAGGGAGASLGGTGGPGGAGRTGEGGAGGMPSAPMAVVFVRGGCRGTPGGNGDANAGGAGGHGGGAVYLIAGASITIAGRINASGQGGRGGQALSGGGGGGGGGFIGLDAPSVVSSGTVFANGGGGGEGGGTGGTGDFGSSGLSATNRAAGGARDPNGGNGGRGAAGAFIDGEGGQVGTNAGGGGGGGIGVIRVFPAQPLGGTVSPTPS